jgi:hypothetical protein
MSFWAVRWRSENSLDGRREHLMWDGHPHVVLFRSRAACRSSIRERYGYIAARPDLRQEPHGWRTPTPVRVNIQPVQ